MEKEKECMKNTALKKWLVAFIPRYIGNPVILFAFDVLRFIHVLFCRGAKAHEKENAEAFQKKIDGLRLTEGYLEQQSSYNDLFYGKTSLSGTGCEIIAAYNALHFLGLIQPGQFPSLISEFERKAIVINGWAGSSVRGIVKVLKDHGLCVGLTTNPNRAQDFVSSYETLIMTIYNDKDDIFRQIHTISITSDENGFWAHNVSGNGQPFGPKENLEDMRNTLNQGKAKMIALIGVSRDATL